MPRKADRYKDAKKLRAAVLKECRARWREIAGDEWSPAWAKPYAAHFRDPTVSPEDQEVREIASDLSVALRRALAFYDRAPLGSGPAGSLRAFVHEQLAPLAAAERRAQRQSDGTYGDYCPWPLFLLDQLADAPPGWEIGKLGRVYVLLSAKAYCHRFGLKEPATEPSTMAVFSILIGEYPDLAAAALIRNHIEGATVAEVIGKQAAAISTAKQRVEKLRAAAIQQRSEVPHS